MLTAACTTTPPSKPEPPAIPATAPQPKPPVVLTEPAPKPPAPPVTSSATDAVYRAVAWSELPGWRDDNLSEAWGALIASCGPLGAREAWREACAAAKRVADPKGEAVRRYFEQHFTPYQIASAESGEEGLITGYYEPLLRGSRKPTERYRHPVYGVPDDLVVVDLSEVYPELKNMRLRGRLEGRRLVPYPDRAQIESGQAAPRGKEIAWVDDAIDLFFLQIQGSGRILLDTG
ncbi:MAG TPA: MltA domain-containing protein, partial [Burkholderiales bacterium]|nr:MltA domain-containing protein [Burkholderiales bacterium]